MKCAVLGIIRESQWRIRQSGSPQLQRETTHYPATQPRGRRNDPLSAPPYVSERALQHLQDLTRSTPDCTLGTFAYTPSRTELRTSRRDREAPTPCVFLRRTGTVRQVSRVRWFLPSS